MTTIFERVENALETLGVPYSNQVRLTPTGSSLPDLFLVYTLITAPTALHADDGLAIRKNRVQVSTFSRSGLTNLPDVDGAMKAAGFIPAAKYQLSFERDTRHYGLAQDYIYLEDQP